MRRLSTILLGSFLAILLVSPFNFFLTEANATTLTSSLKFNGEAFYWPAKSQNIFLVGKADYNFELDPELQWDQDYNWTLDYDINICINSQTGLFTLNPNYSDIPFGQFSLADSHEPPFNLPKWVWFPILGGGYYLNTGHNNGTLYFVMTELPYFEGVYNICFNGNVDLYADPVPVPSAMLLLGSGLVGLAGFRRKFKK